MSDTANQDAILHHQKLLATQRERLALLLVQHTRLGSYTPPHILIDIRETQEALRPIKAWLRAAGMPIEDEPNDDAQIALDAIPPHQPGQSAGQTINNPAPHQGPQGIFHLNNLGALLRAQGELAAARAYLERALAIREQSLGPFHPTTATSLNSLGSLLRAQGELAAARAYFERALEICERMLGPDDSRSKMIRKKLKALDTALKPPQSEH